MEERPVALGSASVRAVPVWAAALADLAVIVVFVAVGRRSHAEDGDIAGFVRVAWPFVTGLAVGWAVTGLYRTPMAWERAVGAWLVTVVVGIALRIAVQGHDLAPAFVVVASVFVGAGMLGWRGVLRSVWRRSARRSSSSSL